MGSAGDHIGADRQRLRTAGLEEPDAARHHPNGERQRQPHPGDLAVCELAARAVPGRFLRKGARFGIHELNREIYAPYYGKIIVAAYFNAGVHVWDIRDPTSPRQIAYFIQAPNGNTLPNCASAGGILPTTYCPKAIFSDLGEVDDRGYIYNMDRAGSGVTVLRLTGNAAQVITGQGAEGGMNDTQNSQ